VEEGSKSSYLTALVIGVLLTFQACSPSTEPATKTSSQKDDESAAPCTWSGVAPSQADLTYVLGSRLFAISSSGTGPTCLLGSVPNSGSQLSWGPRAERILFGPDRAVLPSGKEIAPYETGTAAAWSRPEGKSILGVTPSGRLLKRRTIEPEAIDISFLKRHDEAIYHSAGRHIIAVGVDDRGSYGIFLATNEGKDVRQLAVTEQARRVYSLVIGPTGGSIFYAADHDSYSEVHSLEIEFPGLQTLYKTDAKVLRITDLNDRHPGALAIQTGSCTEGTRVVVAHLRSEQVDQVAGLPKAASVEPVGWLPGDELALLVRDRGCLGKGDLYVSRPQTTSPNTEGENIQYVAKSRLLVRDVEAAAVRAVAPPPPAPPRSSTDPPAG
jgi:hypothetical protein